MSKEQKHRVVYVRSRSRAGVVARISLKDGSRLELRPFAPVGPGDRLVETSNSLSVEVDGGHLVPLIPAWSQRKRQHVGQRDLHLVIKEIETEEELAGFRRLQAFHYRGATAAGRAVPLIVTVADPLLPKVIGFVEITSALLVNNARKTVLDRPFSDRDMGVVWQRWDMAAAKKHTRRIARISRCVVYPELRGLGLSTHLVQAALEFVRERWHFGGARPIFLEITADMLRYIPFVCSSGFHFIGETEGNEARVLRDMRYLLGRSMKSKSGKDYPKGGGGIMDLQRAYATRLHEVMSARNMNLEALLNLLRREPSSLTDDEWIALHRVFRHPKPTYMAGLTPESAKLLATGTALAHGRRGSKKPLADEASYRPALLEVSGLSIDTAATPSSSSRARKVAEAFGVVSREVTTELISKLSLSLSPGQILLVSGPSGSGKSLLLRSLAHLCQTGGVPPEEGNARISLASWRGNPRAAWLEATRSERAAVDLLEHLPLEDALSILAAAGLGEAPLFVKPTKFYSDGQLYRLAIAIALSKNPELLIADAFCEPLDYFSAATVCKRLRNFCRERGIALVAATADASRIASMLKPDLTVNILPGHTHIIGDQ